MEKLPLKEFCGRRCFNQALKHTKTERLTLLKAFCVFLVSSQMFTTHERLFQQERPVWDAIVDADSYAAFCMFMDAHPARKDRQRWCGKRFKYVDTAGEQNRKRKKRWEEFREEDLPAKRAKPSIDREFDAKEKLERFERARDELYQQEKRDTASRQQVVDDGASTYSESYGVYLSYDSSEW